MNSSKIHLFYFTLETYKRTSESDHFYILPMLYKVLHYKINLLINIEVVK